MKVLVTRPTVLATGLCTLLRTFDITVECLPLIDIQPTLSKEQLQTTLAAYSKIDIAIFTSQMAVHQAMPAILIQPPPFSVTQWVAIGASTAASLKRYGLSQVLFPKPPYESESLLELPILQQMSGKRVVLFQGTGGRPLLKTVLQERGAVITIIEVYQRTLPTETTVEKLSTFRHTLIDIIVTTSAESLKNLVFLAGQELLWLQEIPIMVVRPRMYALAKQLGFKKPLLAEGADDSSIIKALTAFKDSTR